MTHYCDSHSKYLPRSFKVHTTIDLTQLIFSHSRQDSDHVAKPRVEQKKVFRSAPLPLCNNEVAQGIGESDIYGRDGVTDWMVRIYSEAYSERNTGGRLDSNAFFSETVCLAVNLFNAFVDETDIPNDYHELVGLTSLLFASKYGNFEVDPTYLVSRCRQTYTDNEILVMENMILTTLDVRVTMTNAHS
eukprot:scaffold9342_cov65-Attheya_sp.AAC.6